jgi:hypothetical protein
MSQDTPEATPSPAEEDLLDEATLRAAWEDERPDADAFLAGVRERVERREAEREQRLLAVSSLPGWSRAAALLLLPKAVLGKVAPAAGSKVGLKSVAASLALGPSLSLLAIVGLFGWLVGLLRREDPSDREPGAMERGLVHWATASRTLDLSGRGAWVLLVWPLLIPVFVLALRYLGDLFFVGILGLGMTAGALSVRALGRAGVLTRAEAASTYGTVVMKAGWLFFVDLGVRGGDSRRLVLLELMLLGAFAITLAGNPEGLRARVQRLLRPESTLLVPDRLTVAILRAGGTLVLLMGATVVALWGLEAGHHYGLGGGADLALRRQALLDAIAREDEPLSSELWVSFAALEPSDRKRVDHAALADALEPHEWRALGIGDWEPEGGWGELAADLASPRMEDRPFGFDHKRAIALARVESLDAEQVRVLRSRNLKALEEDPYCSTEDVLLAALLEGELAAGGELDPALLERIGLRLQERRLGTEERTWWDPASRRGGFRAYAPEGEEEAGALGLLPRQGLFSSEQRATLHGLLALRGLEPPTWFDVEVVRRSAGAGLGASPTELLFDRLLPSSGLGPIEEALGLVLARDFPGEPPSAWQVLVRHRIEVAILLVIALGLFAVQRLPRQRGMA